MTQKYLKVIYLRAVFTAGLFLLMLWGVGIAQEQEEVRVGEAKSIQQAQGRLDSVRKEKVVITYEPEDQQGVQLQTYYLRNENTKFINQGENDLKAGDIVEITYRQSKWTNAEGKKQVERIAKSVRFIRSRGAEELRKEAQEVETMTQPEDLSDKEI